MNKEKAAAAPKYMIPLTLVISLFFMWAIANGLNGILIKHFKPLLGLSRGQAGFVDTSFYLGYFIMALPTGLFMRRYGYKNGIVFGLLLFAGGAFLFYPAAIFKTYWFFLLALFVIASGLTFLETGANPYVTKLGNSETAERRLNFAQAFNGLGWVVTVYFGGKLILGGHEQLTRQMAMMSPTQIANAEASIVQTPYLIIGSIVLLLVLLFCITRMPEIDQDKGTKKINWSLLRQYRHLRLGVLSQFFYVGAQAGIWGYFLYYAHERLPALSDVDSNNYYTIGFVLFMAGRFTGSFLMKYFKPAKLLALYASVNILLIIISLNTAGRLSVYTIMMVSFFMSIMYPTIFSLSIKNMGADTKIASSFLVMAIIGGALFPPVMGYLADWTGFVKYSFLLPLLSFIFILYYALKGHKISIQSQSFQYNQQIEEIVSLE